LFAHSE